MYPFLKHNYQDNLFNYKPTDIVATGTVRPKTTSLFFDKIWIPSHLQETTLGSLLRYDEIPDEVCIKENDSDIYPRINYGDYIYANHPQVHIKTDGEYELDFYNSTYRNFGLNQIIQEFKIYYGIDIVPIYLTNKIFRMSIDPHIFSKQELEKFNKSYSKWKNIEDRKKALNKEIKKYKGFVEDNKLVFNGLQICVNNIPEIIEEKIEWEQVLEIRNDQKSKKSLHRFRNWVNIDLFNKSEIEISSLFQKMCDDYEFALRKHGVETLLGGFSSITASTATILSSINEGKFDFINIGIPISIGLITLTVRDTLKYLEKKRNPIAYLYDVIKMDTK